MFRVFVHVYIHHFDRILELKNLKAEAHGNTLFRHFYFFVKEFQLIEDKELEPLKDLIEKICKWDFPLCMWTNIPGPEANVGVKISTHNSLNYGGSL